MAKAKRADIVYKASCQKVLNEEEFNSYVPLEGEIVVKRGTKLVDGIKTPYFTVKMGKTNGETLEFATTDSIGNIFEQINNCLNEVEEIKEIVADNDALIQSKVDAAINKFANEISDDNIVNTFKELVDYVAEHETESLQFIEIINQLDESKIDKDQYNNDMDNVNERINTLEDYMNSSVININLINGGNADQ